MPTKSRSSKNAVWERDRRNNLKLSFDDLESLLPEYNPSTPLSKVTIIKKAAIFIRDLLKKDNKAQNKDTKQGNETELQIKITTLLTRCKKLQELLVQSGIQIPNNLTEEIVVKLKSAAEEKVLNKENKNVTNKNNENVDASKESGIQKENLQEKKPTDANVEEQRLPQKQTDEQDIGVVPQNTTSAKTKCGPQTSVKKTVEQTKDNKILKTQELNLREVQRTATISTPVIQGSLCPTYILSNGKLLPVVPQATQIIVNGNNNGLVIMRKPQVSTTAAKIKAKNKMKATSVSKPALQRIASKGFKIDLTRTNKVAIPPLTSQQPHKMKTLGIKRRPKPVDRVTYRVLKKFRQNKMKDTKKQINIRKDKTEDNKLVSCQIDKKVEPEKIGETKELLENKKSEEDNKKVKMNNYTIDKLCQDKTSENKVELKSVDKSKIVGDAPENHSELSNDLFASLHVAPGGHHPESTSPTAAFLMAFPLVSTGGKMSEVLIEESSVNNSDAPTLLQIGAIESTTQKNHLDLQTPNLLSLDNFSSFFSSKDMYSNICHLESSEKSDCLKAKRSESGIIEKVIKNDKTNAKTSKSEIAKTSSTCIFSNSDLVTSKTNDIFNYGVAAVTKPEVNKFSHTYGLPQLTTKSFAASTVGNNDNRTDYKYTFAKIPAASQSVASKSTSSDLPPSLPPPKYSHSCNTFNPFNIEPYNNQMQNEQNFSTSNFPHLYGQSDICNKPYEPNKNYMKSNPMFDNPQKTNPFYAENEFKHPKNKTNADIYKYNLDDKCVKIQNSNKPPVNWMTSPDIRQNNDYVLPNIDYQNPIIQSNSFPTSNQLYNNYADTNKKTDSFYVIPPSSTNQIQEDNQFTWSPTKMPSLEPSHSNLALQTTLPTLVGDLALGTPSTPLLNNQENNKYYTDKKKLNNTDSKEIAKKSDIYLSNQNTNFLSVSQLVDHTKSDTNTPRRNVRLKTNATPKQQRKCKETTGIDIKKISQNKNIYLPENVDYYNNEIDNKSIKNNYKNYSAESLINNLDNSNNNRYNQQTFSHFGADNMVPPFFPVDLGGMTTQENQYSSNNFALSAGSSANNASTLYHSNYSSIGTNYIPSTGLINDISNEYNSSYDIFNKNTTQNIRKQNISYANIKTNAEKRPHQNSNYPPTKTSRNNKKSKLQDNNFIDMNYLPIPGGLASPILNDDPFHNHLFNSNTPGHVYQPQNSGIYPNVFNKSQNSLSLPMNISASVTSKNTGNHQAPLPSPNAVNSGTTLTNFNLRTIFPEYNDKVRPGW